MGPKSKAPPKPYVNSALRLDKKKFAELKNIDAFLDFLSKQLKQRHGKKVAAGNADAEKPQKDAFVGLHEVIRNLKRGELGAVVLDEEILKPSTAEHFFGLLGKTQEHCTFFVVKGLSDKAAKHLQINKVSAVGIRKNHSILDSFESDGVETESIANSQVSFQKPTFTVPVGKKNKPMKNKKKPIKAVKKKMKKVNIS